MKQPKLQEKYVDSMKLVTRDRKSNMIWLEREDILCERWYNERKTNIFNESERVVRTVAKLLREAIEKTNMKVRLILQQMALCPKQITLCHIFLKYF